jgi:hypothetical protein
LNEIAISLLIRSLLYESGQACFWNLVDKDFKDLNWKVRMQAVSKCVAIAQHVKPGQIKTSTNVFSSLAFAFSNLIHSTNDIEPTVAQKAITLFETLTSQAIKSIIKCFEMQFDCCIKDRPFILSTIEKCHKIFASKTQSILTWHFFLKRFNSLSIESQLNNDIIAPIDIGGLNAMNNTGFQRRVVIAKFALLKSNKIRSISANFKSFHKENWQKLFTKNIIRNSIKKKIEVERKEEVIEEKELKEGAKPVEGTDNSSAKDEKDSNETQTKPDEQQTKENNNQIEQNTATNNKNDANEIEDKCKLESQIMYSLISLLMQVG